MGQNRRVKETEGMELRKEREEGNKGMEREKMGRNHVGGKRREREHERTREEIKSKRDGSCWRR